MQGRSLSQQGWFAPPHTMQVPVVLMKPSTQVVFSSVQVLPEQQICDELPQA